MKRLLRNTTIAVTLGAASLYPTIAPAGAGAGNTEDRSAKPMSIAVIGDVPYGASQEAHFDDLIQAINADPKVRVNVHVGDIKSGSTECSDDRLLAVYDAFQALEDPMVYTPGDNEWTDCHRPAAGGYNPLERLDTIRDIFFAEPGATLGRRPMRVDYDSAVVENVRWIESRVAIATVHLVGSNNGMSPWTGLGQTAPTTEQLADVQARIDSAVRWVDETFDAAEASGLQGVVLVMQADTFPNMGSGQRAVIDRVVARTTAFTGQVLLLQGDSHSYKADKPLGIENLTRIVVQGDRLPFEYLRLTIDPRDPALFSWDRVEVAATP